MTWISIWKTIYENLYVVPVILAFKILYTVFYVKPKIDKVDTKIDTEINSVSNRLDYEMKITNELLAGFRAIIIEYKDSNQSEHKAIYGIVTEIKGDIKDINKYIRDEKKP